ncbi:MAG: hypothetical protein NUV50_01970 [Rhodospirillales bacterium]|nr:hypothetical protein [Rhodospirillales bacterium]
MTLANKPVLKVSLKPAARLDGSLLLARKGEASPAVAATPHNNPGLAWGASVHPGDFQPQAQPQAMSPVQTSGKASISARLRPSSFFAAHGRAAVPFNNPKTRAAQEREPVALTVRVEDETYLRLKYLAQCTGQSPQQVLTEALDDHLVRGGVPKSRKLTICSE